MSAARLLASAAIMVWSFLQINAQSNPFAVEAGGGASYRFAIGAIGSLPGIPSPRQLSFEPGNASFEPLGHVGVDVVLRSWLGAGLRLSAGSTRGLYLAQERVPIVRADTVFRATLEHRLSANVTMASIEPFVRWWPLEVIAVDLGLPFTIPVNTTYRQTQRFVDPLGLQFVDGSTEQVTGNGKLPDMRSIVTYARARVSAVLPITSDNAWALVPNVGIATSLVPLHNVASWNDVGIDVGLAVRYRPTDTPPPPARRIDTVFVRDTITVLQPGMADPNVLLDERVVSDVAEVDATTSSVTIYERYRRVLPKPPSVLDASVRVVFVGEGGADVTDATIKTRRRKDVRSAPLMPIVVFDDGAAMLPARYVQLSPSDAARFNERVVFDRTGEQWDAHWYHHTLNIVGSRMKRFPRNVLLLRTGGDARLGAARASAVRTYIMQAFGIDTRRVRAEHLADADTGIVRLVDPSCELLGPVMRIDTVTDTRLPAVRIYPDVVSDAGVASWVLDVVQRDSVVHTVHGTGDVPAQIDWNMHADMDASRAARAPFSVALTVLDRDGGKITSDTANVVLREAAIMDASAGLGMSGEWLVLGTTTSHIRPCGSTPPPDAVLIEELDFNGDEERWWNKGVRNAERTWWRGTWRLLKKE